MPYKLVNEARSFEFGLSGADRTHCGTTVADPTGPLRVVTVDFPSAATPIPDRKSTRLNSSHLVISYAVFCLKKTTELQSPCNIVCRLLLEKKKITLNTYARITSLIDTH